MDSPASKEQKDNIDTVCSMTLFGGLSPEPKIPAIKEPNGLSRSDGKRPDGVTIIPWYRGRCLSWDVMVPDIFAASYEHLTSQNAGAAAEKAAHNKECKYAAISQIAIT